MWCCLEPDIPFSDTVVGQFQANFVNILILLRKIIFVQNFFARETVSRGRKKIFPVQFIFLNVEPAIYLAESKGGWVRIGYFIDNLQEIL